MIFKLVLVINCGSSSLKFAIIDPINKKTVLSGIAEYFNNIKAYIKWKINNAEKKYFLTKNSSHGIALNFLAKKILIKYPVLFNNIIAIGHRIVHGGEKFIQSVIINDEVIKEIKKASIFAPLHNPIQLIGIQETLKSFPHLKKKQIAVFDTSFHQTIPKESYLYGLPLSFYEKHKIRRYGAHGTSHRYVSEQGSRILNKPIHNFNCITCHLGNGSSVTAICNGKSVDTSMGLTPLEGLIMGTRCGDIDPAIIFYMNKKLKMDINLIENILINKSGMLGLTDITSDFRYIENNYIKNKKIQIAVKVFVHRLSKYIASYTVLMNNKLDAVIFTGGIGENSILIRELTIKKLKILGMNINKKLNIDMKHGKSGLINNSNSIPILVIPTNEELLIAQDTFITIHN
ncbi:acetate/propionate family kinase [Enterobacteriaceae endosymbiont of Plateumaris consimilis]|uniref:acetate kinase n=1 Tax=Enterobacteriaceae endosymbiont of Plateumaris consimilis TaxID=2675794 RepID=UPI001449DEFD|nr:acetate kinase [Enterobacteriaceae endosymbiont of Plateumaris consimilis]QJC28486.1 acetate/propionate family kinase [Enterobacteriaceae endosymbiont of Plateumaris consimilis]